jgi:hypothetical protein
MRLSTTAAWRTMSSTTSAASTTERTMPTPSPAGLDTLVARLVDEVKSSVGSGGMALESDGEGLLISARNYQAADGLAR